jgi:Bacteriophage replication protein O
MNNNRTPHSQLSGTTPFPNFLLDRVMPRLTDTEWRVLCVVVRQTFGWRDADGNRKKADWLSHFQLKRKTSRASAAISRAIDVLVRSGLIAVRDLDGRYLHSTDSRRRSQSRLCFSVHPLVSSVNFQKSFGSAYFRSSKSENNKRNFDKRKQQRGSEPQQSQI